MPRHIANVVLHALTIGIAGKLRKRGAELRREWAQDSIAGFLILLTWGILLRKNPAAHKRMMILATIALADPGFARFSGWLQPAQPTSVVAWFFYIFYGDVLLIALMIAWDWWQRRLMRSFVVGATALLAAFLLASLLYSWEPWKALSLAWVEAWARHLA